MRGGRRPSLWFENCSAGGGGGTRKPIFPPPSSLAAMAGGGGQGGGAQPAVPGRGGRGVNPTSMAQNDTHVALIILTTQMWGGGRNYWWNFRAKICVPAPSAPTSVLTQNKGPDTEPLFSNPPPPPLSFGRRPCPPPPPPAQSNFQVALESHFLIVGFTRVHTFVTWDSNELTHNLTGSHAQTVPLGRGEH